MPDQSLVTAIYGQLMHRMWSTATTEFKFTLTKIIVHLAAPDAVTLMPNCTRSHGINLYALNGGPHCN